MSARRYPFCLGDTTEDLFDPVREWRLPCWAIAMFDRRSLRDCTIEIPRCYRIVRPFGYDGSDLALVMRADFPGWPLVRLYFFLAPKLRRYFWQSARKLRLVYDKPGYYPELTLVLWRLAPRAAWLRITLEAKMLLWRWQWWRMTEDERAQSCVLVVDEFYRGIARPARGPLEKDCKRHKTHAGSAGSINYLLVRRRIAS